MKYGFNEEVSMARFCDRCGQHDEGEGEIRVSTLTIKLAACVNDFDWPDEEDQIDLCDRCEEQLVAFLKERPQGKASE